jgi:hypothetical protein
MLRRARDGPPERCNFPAIFLFVQLDLTKSEMYDHITLYFNLALKQTMVTDGTE